ncbi:chloride channel protein [Inquilinus limosus]|uniref:chloride channel protein n=1 Tax=Inquilinus limosus TaxID=171674 RepID=UPI0004129622|nr:chloride channel protein [Inquilinus limosus]
MAHPAGDAPDLTLRTLRRLLSPPRLRRMVRFAIGGILVGCMAVAFARAADEAQQFFFWLTDGRLWLAPILGAVGFGVSALAAQRLFPAAPGSGIPQCIAAMRRPLELVPSQLNARTGIGKILLCLFGLACGASIGREGPTVQVGAVILAGLTPRANPARLRRVITAGGAAGLAGAFNTPLAGIVFALEELVGGFDIRNRMAVLAAIFLSSAVAIAVLGDYTYFGRHPLDATAQAVPIFLLVALLAGILGGVFGRCVLALTRLLPLLFGRFGRWSVLIAAASCGLLAGLIGLAAGGATFGTGYEPTRLALEGGQTLAWWFFPAKFAATALASSAGIPGGLFAPSLSVGAGFGAIFAPLVGPDLVPSLMLVGMAAYLTGVTHSPVTALVLLTEMTGEARGLAILIPAVGLAWAGSRLVLRHGLYHLLAERILARAGWNPSATT